MKILVFNIGSSSIKYQLFSMPEEKILAKGLVQRIGDDISQASQTVSDKKIELNEQITDHAQGLKKVKQMLTDQDKGAISTMTEINACGHRVVHGGEAFTGSVMIDEDLEKVIEEYYELAPLHNPPNLTGIRAAKNIMPDIPQIACFDTAFHQSLPRTAYLYALPYDLYEKFKIRKYGFHGTSHKYVAEQAAKFLDIEFEKLNAITCHLGNGCSMAAIQLGKSIDTSMGLTPLEGLVMGTRTGDFDPAIIFHLIRKGYKPTDLDRLMNKSSGLLGISGTSNDVRDLEQKAGNNDERAELALDIFAYRIKKYIGSYLAVLNGCSSIIFTGGIGENGTIMRERIVSNMEELGIMLDIEKNKKSIGIKADISTAESKIKILVIPTDEEKAIARETAAILDNQI